MSAFENLIKEASGRVARSFHTDAFTLVAVVITIVAGWCFLEIADEVVEGEAQRIDEWVVRSLRHSGTRSDPLAPSWLGEVVRDITALGGITMLVLVIGAVTGYLWIRKAYHAMWLVLGASLRGPLLSTLLKGFFQRPRPEPLPHPTHVMMSSFPSGHAMNSAVVYLTLGLLLAQISDRADEALLHRGGIDAAALLRC